MTLQRFFTAVPPVWRPWARFMATSTCAQDAQGLRHTPEQKSKTRIELCCSTATYYRAAVSGILSRFEQDQSSSGVRIRCQNLKISGLYRYLFFLSSGGRGKIKLKPATLPQIFMRKFSYASCVDSTRLLSQPSASRRVLRIPLLPIA